MTSHCCIINTQELGGSGNHIDIKMLSLRSFRFLYKGIIINYKKPSQPTLKRRFFRGKGGVFFTARFWKGVVLTLY